MIREFFGDETGATSVEYGLLAALVAIACFAALEAIGSSVNIPFTTITDKLETKKLP